MTTLTQNEHAMFMRLEEAAMHNQRMPTQDQFLGMGVRASRRRLDGLIAKDYIELRNYGQNWRVVFIKHGQHRGEHSKMPPVGWAEHENSMKRRGAA